MVSQENFQQVQMEIHLLLQAGLVVFHDVVSEQGHRYDEGNPAGSVPLDVFEKFGPLFV